VECGHVVHDVPCHLNTWALQFESLGEPNSQARGLANDQLTERAVTHDLGCEALGHEVNQPV
jgi:hypothetical protein